MDDPEPAFRHNCTGQYHVKNEKDETQKDGEIDIFGFSKRQPIRQNQTEPRTITISRQADKKYSAIA